MSEGPGLYGLTLEEFRRRATIGGPVDSEPAPLPEVPDEKDVASTDTPSGPQVPPSTIIGR
jgi:hypothetical protein